MKRIIFYFLLVKLRFIFYTIMIVFLFASFPINVNAKYNFNDTTNVAKANYKTPPYIIDIIVDSHLYDSLKSDTTHRYYYVITDTSSNFSNANLAIPREHDITMTEFDGHNLYILIGKGHGCKNLKIKLITDGRIDEKGLLHVTTLAYDQKLGNNFRDFYFFRQASIDKLNLDTSKLKGIALHSFEINYYRELHMKKI